LLKKCDVICVGGAMRNRFARCAGHELKGSAIEQDQLASAAPLLEQAPIAA